MKIEPQTEIDREIAAAWPDRWDQANRVDPHLRQNNAKRRNKLRRDWAASKYRTFLTDILPHYQQTLERLK